MNNLENNLLTPNQFTKLIILSIIGIDILSFSNNMVIYAKQDGWLIPILGLIYPLYIVMVAVFLYKKHPNENILVLSKRYLGQFLGGLMNFIYLLIFILYAVFQCVGTANFFIAYVINFLSNTQFYIFFIPIAAYSAYLGLKQLGRISEVVFYIFILFLVFTVLAFYRGSYLNLLPVFKSGGINIAKGLPYGIYPYSGIEVVFLLCPHINDKSKIKSSSLKAVLISCGIFVWFTVATIFYLSVNVMKKNIWPSIYIIESLRLTVITSFGFVNTFLLSFTNIANTSIFIYCSTAIVNDFFKAMDRKIIIIAVTILIFIISLFLGDEVKRRAFMAFLLPFSVIFNFLYVLVIAILIIIKKVSDNEKQS